MSDPYALYAVAFRGLPTAMALSALTMGESDRGAFWKNIKAFYDGDLFCDLVFICKGGLSVTCHQLVLASLSKKLATLLKAANETMEESLNTVHLPDLSYKEVQECVDFLYAILAIELPRETKITLKSEVVKTMGLDLSQLGLPTKAGEVEASSEDEEEDASEEEWSPSPEDSSAVSLKEVRRPLRKKRREEEEEADGDRETKKAKLGSSDKENQIGSSQVIRLVTMSGALSSSSATPSSSKATITTSSSSSPVLKLSGAAQKVKLLPGAKVTTAVVRTADGQEKKVILAVKNPSVVETPAPTKSGATKKGLTFPHRKNVACTHCKKEFQTWRLLKVNTLLRNFLKNFYQCRFGCWFSVSSFFNCHLIPPSRLIRPGITQQSLFGATPAISAMRCFLLKGTWTST